MQQPSYISTWSRLEAQSAFYKTLLKQLPEAQLKATPSPAVWSVLQVIEHLVAAEEAVLQYLLRKQYAPLESRSFMPAGLRSFLLTLALRSPMKFKAPKVLGEAPSNKTEAVALLQHWDSVRAKLRQYVDQMPAKVASKPLFRHPRAGVLTLEQTLQFMAEHLQHHQKQVNNILAQKESLTNN